MRVFIPHLLRPLIVAALTAIVLAGCAANNARIAMQDLEARNVPRQTKLPVDFVPQKVNHCGPAVLSMAAGFASGKMPDIDTVADTVFTAGREGTLRYDMITGARRMGLLATHLNSLEDVLAEVAAGNPVVLFENRGLAIAPVWHFSLLVGYDLEKEVAILHSDQTPYAEMNLSRLGHIWARGGSWAFVVTPPDRLPHVNDSAALLAAAHGLSRAGKPELARTSFKLIAQRFPEESVAQFAYGNAAFDLGSLSEAEKAYRRAIQLGDERGQAHNNLAYVLAKRGHEADACAMAKEAKQRAPDDENIRASVTELCGVRY